MALLHLPDLRQDRPHACGETAAWTVLSFFSIAARPRIASPIDGIDPIAVERAMRKLHLRVLSGSMTVDDLRHYCHVRHVPVICLVHFEGSGESHYVTVRGVSRGHVYYQDPEAGPAKLPVGEWERAWTASDGRLAVDWRGWGIAAWPP